MKTPVSLDFTIDGMRPFWHEKAETRSPTVQTPFKIQIRARSSRVWEGTQVLYHESGSRSGSAKAENNPGASWARGSRIAATRPV